MTTDPSEDRPDPTPEPTVDDSPTAEHDAATSGDDAPAPSTAGTSDTQATQVDLRPVPEADEPPADDHVLDTGAFMPVTAAEAAKPGAATDEEVVALRDVAFPLAIRGYNTAAVDRYVAQVERAIARFEENREPTVAVRAALDRVGEQTTAILREAERSAEETTTASRAKADDRVQRAEREAAELWAAAQAKARSLDDDIERLWQERQRLIDATRELSERLRSTAEEAESRFPPEEAPTSVTKPATAAAALPKDDDPAEEHPTAPIVPGPMRGGPPTLPSTGDER
jgi:DivIVA domain-containing protein